MGFLLLLLGGIGILIPILPTTPFVLLASACFIYSNKKIALWLENTKYFGDYIKNYQNHTGVPKKVKGVSLGFLWFFLVLSMFLVGKWPIVLLLIAVGIGVTIHILTLKTKVDPPL